MGSCHLHRRVEALLVAWEREVTALDAASADEDVPDVLRVACLEVAVQLVDRMEQVRALLG